MFVQFIVEREPFSRFGRHFNGHWVDKHLIPGSNLCSQALKDVYAMGRGETEEVLREWRARILNVSLAIVAVAATEMTGISIFETISRPCQWSTVILFTILTLVLAVLALSRGNDNSIRA